MTQVGDMLGWHPVCVQTGMRFELAFLLVAHGNVGLALMLVIGARLIRRC